MNSLLRLRLGAALGFVVILLGLAAPVAEAVPGCFGKVADYAGTDDRNIVRGSQENDVITGLGGDDLIVGRGGKDRICGNAGNDALRGQGKNDRISGGTEDDILTGGGGDDTILGGPGEDSLFDQAGDDVLNGGPGDDQFDPRAGDDRMFGFEGNDTLIGGVGNDTYDGGDGYDLASFVKSTVGVRADLVNGSVIGEGSDSLLAIEALEGTNFPDLLAGDSNANRLFGGAGDDCDSDFSGCPSGASEYGLFGGDGNDELFGEEGDDDLLAGSGDDFLDGGSGAETVGDNLKGGPGNDRCINGEIFDGGTSCETGVRSSSGWRVDSERRGSTDAGVRTEYSWRRSFYSILG